MDIFLYFLKDESSFHSAWFSCVEKIMASFNYVNLCLYKTIEAMCSKWLWVRRNVQSNLSETEASQ